MDTYASSAGDPGGFYNIPALGPVVDAFFVMDYELNLAGAPSAASPLTSGMFSTQTTLAQYDAAVPASKVILGTPFFGIDWPTSNGTMGANATGGAADIADSQAAGNGPEYWDPVTDTAWTSYQVGSQWHESYYEGENGLYDVSQLATQAGARGRRHLGARHGERRGADDRGARRDLARCAARAPGPSRPRPARPPPLRRRPPPARRGPHRQPQRPGPPPAPRAAPPKPQPQPPPPPPGPRPRPGHRPAGCVVVPRTGAHDHHDGAVHHRGLQRGHGRT